MKVYWTDREGKPAPQSAIFQCFPFFSNDPSPFTQNSTQRIETLPLPAAAKVLKRSYLPKQEEWTAAVHTVLAGKIEKVVLARCQVLELAEAPDPFALAAMLQKKSQGAYVFCFSEGDLAFFGATPERLFLRKQNLLYSEAVAGTRPRGNTPKEDKRLGTELLTSSKDHRELSPVQQFLIKNLTPLSLTPPSFTPYSLHRTQNVQHLYTQCNAVLKETVSDIEILKQIHPTPALAGVPLQRALELIRTLEPFHRGLYGGALGWSASESSEYVVGIRSCLVRGKTAYLYAGAGIVAGSDPEKEWEELNQKSMLYDEVFV